MKTRIPYNCDAMIFPHILINKWFHGLRHNCKDVKNPKETGKSKERKIFYQINFVGKNIRGNNAKP